MNNLKSKFLDLLDDIHYYLIRCPRSFYYEVKDSIHSVIKRFPYVLKQRDWDYGYVLNAEIKELEILRDGISRYQNHVNWKRDVETLNTAIRMLKEINDEEGYCFGLRDKRYVNDRNLRRFLNSDSQFDSYKKLKKHPDTYKCSVRERKIWHLYHKYREYYMRGWWD